MRELPATVKVFGRPRAARFEFALKKRGFRFEETLFRRAVSLREINAALAAARIPFLLDYTGHL